MSLVSKVREPRTLQTPPPCDLRVPRGSPPHCPAVCVCVCACLCVCA